jgi:serine/threonine protein kinase
VTADTPRSLGRYEIDGEIGRGMMGVVYRAFDPALGRNIALKTVRLAFSIPEDQREVFERRFLGEARIAAALSHPGIVVVHDLGRDPETGTLFIALEFLEGRTLAEIAKEGGPMELTRTLRLVSRIAEALAHAHSQGVVHRDIKPANIMVLPSGEPKIMDFGIAKIPAAQLTAAGEFFGTPSYMSPEQARGASDLDGRSDLFSLGAILYLLLTGEQAFSATNVPAILLRVSAENPPPPSSLAPGIPAAVDRLVARMLAKEPGMRYPTGRAVVDAIEAILAALGAAPLPVGAPREADVPTAPKPRPHPGGRGSRTWVGLLAILLALGVAGALSFRSAPPSTRSTSISPNPVGSPSEPPPLTGLGLFGGSFASPAHLEVDFEFPFRTGRLKLWIDDAIAVDQPLEGHLVVRKLSVLSLKSHKGRFKKTLDLAPGEHTVRVEVDSEGETHALRSPGTFKSGVTRHLEVTFGGLVRKELGLEWWS